jgi:Prokaryotic cytochrome b561
VRAKSARRACIVTNSLSPREWQSAETLTLGNKATRSSILTSSDAGWRLTNASLPPFPTQMTKLHRATVKLSEYGLYALLLGQPVTGLLTTLFSGRPFALLLWQFSPLIPRDEMLRAAFHLSHELGAWALAALAVGHAAAALFHHFVLRDDVLECMAPVMQRHVPGGSSPSVISVRSEVYSRKKCIRGIKATHFRSCW